MSNDPKRGVLYILSNPHIPGLLKIGQTTRDPFTRAKEISSATGVPADFEVIYDAIVSDVDAAEKALHDALASVRINKSREFFRVGIREAIGLLQQVADEFPVSEEDDANSVEILPQLEARMRRWLRHDLVSVKFVQFSDLCVLRVTNQPSVASQDAYEIVHDLRVLGDYENDDVLFSPTRNTLKENVAKFLDLDAYSMEMVGLGLINDEASEYVGTLVEELEIEPPIRPIWEAIGTRYEMWGSAVSDNSKILAQLRDSFESSGEI